MPDSHSKNHDHREGRPNSARRCGEEVIKDSAAEKAGFQAGDVLLAWNRDDATGNIESPFDASSLAIEQAPRGKVSLKGRRINMDT